MKYLRRHSAYVVTAYHSGRSLGARTQRSPVRGFRYRGFGIRYLRSWYAAYQMHGRRNAVRCGGGGGTRGEGGAEQEREGEKKESPDGPKWNEKIKIKIKNKKPPRRMDMIMMMMMMRLMEQQRTTGELWKAMESLGGCG